MASVPKRLDDMSLDNLGAIEARHGGIEVHLSFISRLLVCKGGREKAGRIVTENEVDPGRELFPFGEREEIVGLVAAHEVAPVSQEEAIRQGSSQALGSGARTGGRVRGCCGWRRHDLEGDCPRRPTVSGIFQEAGWLPLEAKRRIGKQVIERYGSKNRLIGENAKGILTQ